MLFGEWWEGERKLAQVSSRYSASGCSRRSRFYVPGKFARVNGVNYIGGVNGWTAKPKNRYINNGYAPFGVTWEDARSAQGVRHSGN
jgi:hypothetical protein